MKNTIKYTLFLFIIALSSCSDEFIEKAPISEGNAENFYKTADDFEAAIIATYANLRSPNQYGSSDTRYGGAFYALMEVRADDASDGSATSGAGKDVFDIDTFVDNPLSGVIEDAWISIFKTIFDANAIITRIGGADLDSQVKAQYTAEARFLRGLCYFNAVRLWGKVPVVLTEITPQQAKTLSRDDVAAVYAAIEADFGFAAQNLPASVAGKEGRATSGAAKAFLGKVYLTQQKWGDATKVLIEVVQSKTYDLEPNVQDVFKLDNELDQEILFAIRFSTATDLGHFGFGTPTYTALSALYDAADARLALLAPVGSGDPDSTYPTKQHDPSSGEKGRDFPVLRYSDVLLMLAEAQNETAYQASGDAFKHLNAVRSRAGLAALTSTAVTNQDEFRTAVLKERRLELALESHRWFDLLRTNEAANALSGAGIKAHQLLYPIPQNEINVYNDASKFPQNTGY